ASCGAAAVGAAGTGRGQLPDYPGGNGWAAVTGRIPAAGSCRVATRAAAGPGARRPGARVEQEGAPVCGRGGRRVPSSGGPGTAVAAACGLPVAPASTSALITRGPCGADPLDSRPVRQAPGKLDGCWGVNTFKLRFFLRKVLTEARQVMKMARLLRRGSRAVKGIRL